MKSRDGIILVLEVALAMTVNGTALADAAAPGGETRLEEVVVTANRRAENLQQVPIAVSAITASVAEGRGVVDLQSIATAVPGLTTSRALGSNSPYIRGVGNPAPEIANEPSVATYVDDVYTPTGAATLFDFNNIDRVEVLKGPQGTLFGRNATGGVIHVLTRDPTQKSELVVSLGGANYDTYSGNLYGNMGVTDSLAFNVALHAKDRSTGWGRNLKTGGEASKDQDYSGRAKLLWTPGDSTRVLFAISSDHSEGAPGLARTPIPGVVVSNPPGAPVGNVGFYNTNLTVDPNYTSTETTASAKLEQDLSFARLVSISAYSTLSPHVYYDLDISPFNAQIVDIGEFNRMFTQELQLKAKADAKLQWIVGAFYLHDNAGFSPQRVIVTGGSTIQDIRSAISSSSIAGFGQASLEVLPGTHLTAGARYTHDKRSVEGTTAINGTINPAATKTDDHSWAKPTWRVALDHEFSNDLMVYASVNTGFKSGVYNPTSYTAAPANPETLTAYELGMKSEWLEHRLRINSSVFYYDYSNMQVTVIVVPPSGVPTSFTQNAAKARVKGLDLELTALPVEHLVLTGGLSLLDGKYTQYPSGAHFSPRPTSTCTVVPYPANATGGQVAVAGCDLSGNDMIQAPRSTFNVSANYVVPTSIGSLNFNAAYFHTTKWFFEADNSVGNDAYGLLNASVGWTSSSSRYSATLWGRNLTNSEYFLSGASSSAARYYAPAEPRTYGVTVSMTVK